MSSDDIYNLIVPALKFIAPAFISGGVIGAFLNNFYKEYKERMQNMQCLYTKDIVLSYLPISGQEGNHYKNMHQKEFVLKNTTNKDHEEFNIIFEFDPASTITQVTIECKTGINKFPYEHHKPNGLTATIKHFNRNDKVVFVFQVANITDAKYAVVEDKCIGFKIKVVEDIKQPISQVARVPMSALHKASDV